MGAGRKTKNGDKNGDASNENGEGAVAAGLTRSGIWDMLSLRCLFNMYVERSRGRGWMSLVFRGEVWARDVNFGVVSGKMVFKAKKLDELTRE